MYAMGLRMRESVSLSWSDYHETYWIIRGKRTKRNRNGFRPFALVDAEGRETVPGILEIVERLKGLADRRGEEKRVKVFRWRNEYDVNSWFLPLLRRLGLRPAQGGGRSVKTVRASAIYQWEHVLRWPKELRAMFGGHSEEVQERYYLTDYRPEELIAAASDFRHGKFIRGQ
jgi:integrase